MKRSSGGMRGAKSRKKEREPDTAQIRSPWQHSQAAGRVGGRCSNVSLTTALQSKTPASLSMEPGRPAEQQAANCTKPLCTRFTPLLVDTRVQ